MGRDVHFLFLLLFLSTSLFDLAQSEYDCDYKKDGFYSDTDFCHIYWRCNYGVAEEYECPAGTAWNHKESRCDWLDNVDCSRIDETKMDEDREKYDDEDDDDDEDNENDESEYYDEEIEEVTKKPKRTQKVTEPPEEATEPEAEYEYEDEAADLTKAVETTTERAANQATSKLCQSFGSYFVADPANCASYFMCNNGKENRMNCADKQLFNADTQQCEEFQQVFCGSRPVNLADRNQCASKRDGIFPDLERQCRVFYKCVNQQKVREATCPNKLKYNSITGRCDNAMNIVAPCGTFVPSSSLKLKSSTLAYLFVAMLMIKCFAL